MTVEFQASAKLYELGDSFFLLCKLSSLMYAINDQSYSMDVIISWNRCGMEQLNIP